MKVLNKFKNILADMVILVAMVSSASGCAVIGTFPEPDPMFKVAGGFGPHDKKGCLVVPGQAPDCSSADERAANYLATFIPSSPNSMVRSLEKNEFDCQLVDTTWHCLYTKSQAPAVCAGALRITVVVTFPAETSILTQRDMIVKTTVSPDPQNHDDRGCMPL